MRFSTKLALRVAVIGVAAAAVGLPAVSASAVATPAISISPATALTNGQSVTVTGSNFGASEAISLVQCHALTATGCSGTSLVTTTTDGAGAFTKAFVVHTGTIGDGTCAAGSSSCIIVAANTAHTEIATTTLPFAAAGPTVTIAPKTARVGQTVTVTGAGFKKSTMAYVLQCSDPTNPSTGCNTSKLATPTTNAKGGFTVKFTVNNACKVGTTCFIVATTSTSGDPAQSGAGQFTVAKALPVLKTATAAKASKKVVATGKKFVIAGTVKAAGKGVAGLKVSIVTVTRGKIHKVGVAVTRAGGKFAKTLKGLKKTAHYQVRTAKQAHGGKVYGASNSRILTVK